MRHGRGSSLGLARDPGEAKGRARGIAQGIGETMLLKINEFKKKRKKFEISLDKKVESGIHFLS
jgi:hypothetical protein